MDGRFPVSMGKAVKEVDINFKLVLFIHDLYDFTKMKEKAKPL